MLAFLINIIIIAIVMWVFFRFMYPKPPKAFFAKTNDDTSERCCDFCQTSLATYRGIFIPKTLPPNQKESDMVYQFSTDDKHKITDEGWFFCNGEHQIAFCQAQGLDVSHLQAQI